MSGGDFELLERLFSEIVDLEPAERLERLGGIETGDPDLARRLRDLIDHDEAVSDDFLQPAAGGGGDWEVVQEDLLGDGGAELGPYRIRELLFEGGMGRVYLAEQAEPLSRVVALKVLASPNLGHEVLERFRLEQAALASLNHPNVAAIFDSGLTPAGAPWFAMEYVDGAPITRFAVEHELDLEQRLAVFLQLCDALQHAHETGLVHRDIKPGNVLVCERDGQPVLKLIDFGIAKATGTALASGRTLTQDGLMIGTPEYMSPEQCGAQSSAVGVRSDIYSLGLVLYELITDSRPHDWSSLRDGGLGAILKAIQQEEPPLPSTRVEQAQRARRLRGDLDWIVQKAIDKEPSRRYASVAELAEDLRRRERDEPVLAGPPSGWYRLRKLARRRALPLAAGAAVFTALVIGGGVAVSKVIEAREERALTEQAEGLMRWNRYAGSLASAEEALSSNDVAGARRSLERAPEELRGWEWRQLSASLDDTALLLEPHAIVISDLDVGQRFAVSVSLDGELRLWDLSDGFSFTSRSLGGLGSWAVALLEERGALVVRTHGGELLLTDLDTGEERAVLAEGVRSATDVVHLPERGELALGTEEGTIRRWDIDTGVELAPLTPVGERSEIRSLVALPGGRHLVAGTNSGVALCWDLDSSTLAASRRLAEGAVWSLAAHPGGERIVAGTADGTMTFLDAGTLELRRALTTSGGSLVDLEWSRDGEVVVSASGDGRVRRWTAEHGALLTTLRGHSRGGIRVEELPGDGRLLTGGADGALRLFDPGLPAARRRTPPANPAPQAMAVSHDGNWQVTVAGSGAVVRRDVRTGEVLVEVQEPTTVFESVVLSADGERVLTGSLDGRVGWRLASTLEPLGTVQVDEGAIVALAPLRGGGRLIAGTETDRVFEVNLSDGQAHLLAELARCRVADLAVSPASELVAVGCVRGRSRVELIGASPARRIELEQAVSALAFISEGEELAIGLHDGTVRIVEISSGELRAELVGHVSAVTGIVELPGGQRLATSSRDGTVRIWSRDFDVPLTTLRPGLGRLDGLTWVSGPDERLVAIGQGGLVTYAVPDPLRPDTR